METLTALAAIAGIASPFVALWIHSQGAASTSRGNERTIKYKNLDHGKRLAIFFAKKYHAFITIPIFSISLGYIIPHIVLPFFLFFRYIIKNNMGKTNLRGQYASSIFVFLIFGATGSIFAHHGIVAFYDRFPACELLDLRHELCRPSLFNSLDIGAWLGFLQVI
jgi:hypothetical protein